MPWSHLVKQFCVSIIFHPLIFCKHCFCPMSAMASDCKILHLCNLSPSSVLLLQPSASLPQCLPHTHTTDFHSVTIHSHLQFKSNLTLPLPFLPHLPLPQAADCPIIFTFHPHLLFWSNLTPSPPLPTTSAPASRCRLSDHLYLSLSSAVLEASSNFKVACSPRSHALSSSSSKSWILRFKLFTSSSNC